MNTKSKSSQTISPLLVAALLAASGSAIYFVQPSKRELIDRLMRDGQADRALQLLHNLSERERNQDSLFYALAELRLMQRTLQDPTPAQADEFLQLALKHYVSSQFAAPFFEPLIFSVKLAQDPKEAHEKLKPFLLQIPFDSRAALYEALVVRALALPDPLLAATIYTEHWTAHCTESTTQEAIRLWRLAGHPQQALDHLDRLARSQSQASSSLEKTFALARITLLRELGRPAVAFLTAKNLMQRYPEMERSPLLDLLITTAKESNQGAEALPYARRRAIESPSAELWQALGDLATAANKQAEAIAAYENLLALQTNDSTATAKLAQLYEWSNRPDDAFTLYSRLIHNKDYSYLDRFLALGQGLFRDEDVLATLQAFSDQITRSDLNLAIARFHTRVGGFVEAKRHYQIYFDQEPLDFKARIEYGDLLLNLHEYDDALVIFEAARLKQPESQQIDEALADIYLRKKRFHDALAVYERLKERQPNAFDQYLNLAESLGLMRQVSDGLQQKIRTSAATPYDFERLAYLLSRQGKQEAYIACLNEGLARFPNHPDLLETLAYALGNKGDFLKAAQMIRKSPVLEKNAGLKEFYVSMLIQAQRYSEAEQFLSAGSDQEFLTRPNILEFKAQILEANNKTAEAASVFGQLHQLHPDRPLYAMNYARLLSATGRSKEAQQIIQPFLHESSPEILHLAAQVYTASGEHKLAEIFQRRYLSSNPRQASRAWGFLGDILLSRGDKANAKRAYQHSLDMLFTELDSSAIKEVAK